MSQDPMVSIIMANFNKGSYVKEAIECILSQTFSKFEFIIVDDGSNDESPSIIEEFEKKDDRITYMKRQHMGASAARNLAIEKAHGELIAFMDSDDTCSKDKISKQVRLFAPNQTFICYTDGWIIDQAGVPTGAIFNRDLERIPIDGCDGHIFSRLVRRNYIIDSSVMMPRDLLMMERFDKDLSIGYDTDLWVRLARHYPFRYVPEPLYGYRMYSGNTWSKRNETLILKNHILMYRKWLRTFYELDSKDRRVIAKYAWNSYIKLRDRRGLLEFAINDGMARSFLVSRIKSYVSSKLGVRPKGRQLTSPA